MNLGNASADLPPRKPRRPQHNYVQSSKAWEINVAAIAPVLPGETLMNAVIQERLVSAPLRSSTIGWHAESYLFYCTHRQIGAYLGVDLTAFVMNNTTVLSTTGDDPSTYFVDDGGGYNWAQHCRQLIVQEWFREQGETPSTATGRNSRPLAKVGYEGIGESLMLDSAVVDGANVASATDMTDLDQQRQAWEYMRSMSWTRMTYEDWIATYGVDLPKVQNRDRPELLRRWSEWTYPVNVVNPATGAPSSAVSWGIAGRADKRRFFPEPGFIVLLRIQRPKVYRSLQRGHASGVLDRVQRWLPALQLDDPAISLVDLSATTGIFGRASNGAAHWYDVRDLFVHGDQWVDVVSGSGSSEFANSLPLPANTTLQNRYATEAMSDSLFAAAAESSPPSTTDYPTLYTLRADGNLALSIMGRQEDFT